MTKSSKIAILRVQTFGRLFTRWAVYFRPLKLTHRRYRLLLPKTEDHVRDSTFLTHFIVERDSRCHLICREKRTRYFSGFCFIWFRIKNVLQKEKSIYYCFNFSLFPKLTGYKSSSKEQCNFSATFTSFFLRIFILSFYNTN